PAGLLIGYSARRLAGSVAAGGVMAAGVSVREQQGIAAGRIELAVGFVGDRRLRQRLAALEREIADRERAALDIVNGARMRGSSRRSRGSSAGSGGRRAVHPKFSLSSCLRNTKRSTSTAISRS